MAPRKIDFALKARSTATSLAEAIDEIEYLADVYVASGYQSNGANPITAEDLQGHDISIEQLMEFAILAANLLKFMSGEASAEADYQQQLNAFRNV